MARFKCDENLPREAIDLFRGAGHDAMGVLDQRMGGDPDERIAEVCKREARALVTLDLDFADIRAYPPREHPGLIVLRPHRQDKPHLLGILTRLLPSLTNATLNGELWIVDETTVRVHD